MIIVNIAVSDVIVEFMGGGEGGRCQVNAR